MREEPTCSNNVNLKLSNGVSARRRSAELSVNAIENYSAQSCCCANYGSPCCIIGVIANTVNTSSVARSWKYCLIMINTES